MGRAIARRLRVYLMDEPLSNLDAKLRVRGRADLARLHAQLGVTTVCVTRDQVEAMQLGQRAAVMRDGRIQQAGRPQTLYRDPANLFVASFIGSPSMNLVRGELDGEAIRFAGHRLPLDRRRRPPTASPAQVILGIAPRTSKMRSSLLAACRPSTCRSRWSRTSVRRLAFFAVDAERLESETLSVASERSDEETLMAADRQALFAATLDASTASARTTARPCSRPPRFPTNSRRPSEDRPPPYPAGQRGRLRRPRRTGSRLLFMVWSTAGLGMLVFLAGLQNVSRELREAAALDGATRRQILRTITLPLLTPIIFLQLVLGLIAAAQMMIQPILLGSSIGSAGSPFFYAPAQGADIFPAHIFDVTFIGAAAGTGAALSWMFFLVVLAVTLVLFATSKLWVFYGSD
jgi:hypothetical protein